MQTKAQVKFYRHKRRIGVLEPSLFKGEIEDNTITLIFEKDKITVLSNEAEEVSAAQYLKYINKRKK